MSLAQALSTALSGLKLSQSQISLVGGNIANAETPGFTRRSAVPIAQVSGEIQNGVRLSGVSRAVDVFVQRQLRMENAGGSYSATMAEFHASIDTMFGRPGSPGGIDALYSRFKTTFAELATSPDSQITRAEAISAARDLAQSLNGLSNDIQNLRTETETRLASAIDRVNALLSRIEAINRDLQTEVPGANTTVGLLDDRDKAVDELSRLIDIRVIDRELDQISIVTGSGVSILGSDAARFDFLRGGPLSPQSVWTEDPATRGVASLTITGTGIGGIDVVHMRAIRSGEIAALLEMRDKTLVELQARVDGVAGQMALAVSARTLEGTAVAGPPAGFDVDLTNLQHGAPVRVTTTTGATQTRWIVVPTGRADLAGQGETVIEADFSGGPAAIRAALATALGTGFTVAGSDNTLAVRGSATGTVNALSAVVTATQTTGQGPALPLFLDGPDPFTGSPFNGGQAMTGISARLVINPALIRDPSRLVISSTSPLTPSGDATRPNLILERLSTTRLFGPETNMGGLGTPWRGTIDGFLRETIGRQGQAREQADRLAEGQKIVVDALRDRAGEISGVDIDAEMAKLLTLQTAYAANARVMTTVRDMFELLMR